MLCALFRLGVPAETMPAMGAVDEGLAPRPAGKPVLADQTRQPFGAQHFAWTKRVAQRLGFENSAHRYSRRATLEPR